MNITFSVAFVAGVLSVFSPCILPLLPSYFAYLSGIEVKDMDSHRKKIVKHAIFFALGFSVVFLLFGAAIGTIGKTLLTHKRTVEIIGGIIILIFALQVSGIFRKLEILKFLEKEKKFHIPTHSPIHIPIHSTHSRSQIPIKSLLTGMIFAFGWSPCYGPILGSIFTLAIAETSFIHGITLFGTYSLGMGVTLILIALLASKASIFIKKTRKFQIAFNVVMALILLTLSISMLTGGLGNLANTINDLYIEHNLNIF